MRMKFCQILMSVSLMMGSSQLAFATETNNIAPSSEKAILVIRFNQPHVQYRPALKEVVNKVLTMKPTAQFYIHSLIPSDETAPEDSQPLAVRQQLAKKNGEKIKHAIEKLGVKPAHLHLSIAESDSVSTNEIHLSAK